MVNDRVTQPEEDLVRLYLKDIGKYRLLSKEDEVSSCPGRRGRSLGPGRAAR